jgi:hypothetical protein
MYRTTELGGLVLPLHTPKLLKALTHMSDRDLIALLGLRMECFEPVI